MLSPYWHELSVLYPYLWRRDQAGVLFPYLYADQQEVETRQWWAQLGWAHVARTGTQYKGKTNGNTEVSLALSRFVYYCGLRAEREFSATWKLVPLDSGGGGGTTRASLNLPPTLCWNSETFYGGWNPKIWFAKPVLWSNYIMFLQRWYCKLIYYKVK